MEYSKEEIQKLVIDAEILVREDLKTPPHHLNTIETPLISRRKEKTPLTNPKTKVEQWLQTQPQPSSFPSLALTTDGEASCECTESDSGARDSDASDGVADSVATCLPGAAHSTSQTASTEIIGGMDCTDHLKETSDNNCSQTKVIVRQKRRNSERPWSVACLSQLTQQSKITNSPSDDNTQGLANHSISESALHKLNNTAPSSMPIRGSASKSSLKKRRMRSKRKQRSESGSNASDESGVNRRNSNSSLIKSESFSGRIVLTERIQQRVAPAAIPSDVDSEDAQLPKPNFQLGALTSNVFNKSQLGALAPLAFYDAEKSANNIRESSYTGTEDNSNQSEQQVWDDYQEKYLSEAYSEGRDSEAARKLLEFGDDYRNFLDSQSDCCSSLSNANNLDSLSPPRYRKNLCGIPVIGNGSKSSSKSPEDENTLKRRRALELEIERRHRESHRKGSMEGKLNV